ncbi:MAG: hypothetical protein GAK43_02355 [Stenotrophomonas maltophilia]|nr:MAG: hypothetical protein GAK43_02355 [Stenotrophomonas maltophilia]
MSDNPFASATASPSASAALRPVPDAGALRQALAFVAAHVGASFCLLLIKLAMQWFGADSAREYFGELWPVMFGAWVGDALLGAAAILLLVQALREHYRIRRLQPLASLLIGFVLLSLLCGLVSGALMGQVSQLFYRWALDGGTRMGLISLYGEAMGWLFLGTNVLLPLWLVLHLARRSSLPQAAGEPPLATPAALPALGIALGFAALLMQLLSLASSLAMALPLDLVPWQRLLVYLGMLPALPIIFFAAHGRLPAQLARFSAGRVVAATLLIMLIWGALAALLAGLAFLGLFVLGALEGGVFLLVGTLLLYGLLWPLTRFSVLCCFGA